MRKTTLILIMGLSCITLCANALEEKKVTKANKEWRIINAFEINSFCKAIIQGDIDLVKKMIDLGEDVNQKSLGKTPAHYAARYNKAEILELLIQNGANIKKRCDHGYTVKRYAELAHAEAALEVINATMKS